MRNRIPVKQSLRSFRFKRWSRKNYAVFAGLHTVISIGHISADISDQALRKNCSSEAYSLNRNIVTDTRAESEESDWEPKETTEQILQMRYIAILSGKPAEAIIYCLLNTIHKLEQTKCLHSNFFILNKSEKL